MHQRPTWAVISLPALIHNFRVIRRYLDPQVQVMAVVKADAYGHGAVECAHALEAAGVDWFGVALVEEGVRLRQAGISRPIFCLGGFWQGQANEIVEYDLTPAIFRLDAAEELNAAACIAGRIVNVHIKVDTGMGRLGIAPQDVQQFAYVLKGMSNLKLDGVFTHFADASAEVGEYTKHQIEEFNTVVRALKQLGINITYLHMAGSAGLHAYPEAWGNLVRVGAALYGLTGDVLAPAPAPFPLSPVMSLHSRIVFLKDVPSGTPLGYGRTFTAMRQSRIATLPIGYADGLRRTLSNKGQIIIRGHFAPIVGRVSMDMTLIDVTDVPNVAIGDEVLLIGSRDGLRISAEDLAKQIGTISYEIVCGISNRIPRVY